MTQPPAGPWDSGMAAGHFDDSRLDDQQVLLAHDADLRELAMLGARVRTEVDRSGVHGRLEQNLRPRGILAVGPEARLIRAVLEPVCPSPFVAWSLGGLPGWVGSLDLVIVLGSGNDQADSDGGLLSTVVEAKRRGCALLVAAPEDSPIAQAAQSVSTWLLPTSTGDPLAAAVAVLGALDTLGLGPQVHPDSVAEAADMVAEECSPYRDISVNPAKDLAIAMAEAQALIWGGSVLAARASRRVAEAVRRASGRAALAADADALAPVLRRVPLRDPFADPVDHPGGLRPVLLVLDDEPADPMVGAVGAALEALAGEHEVRVCRLAAGTGEEVDRYVTLLQQGRYGAAYLGIGLGLEESE